LILYLFYEDYKHPDATSSSPHAYVVVNRISWQTGLAIYDSLAINSQKQIDLKGNQPW